LAEQGELEPINAEFVPNITNLYPEANDLAYDPGNKISVPYAWGTTGLCYREDLTGYDPTSWNDLLDPKPELEGKTTMIASERWLALPAQRALGFSVNTTDPDELEQVEQQLLETKPTLLAYDDVTFYQRLIDGEASLVQAWDGWCNYGIAEDDRIKWVVPDEGSDLWTDVIVIPESSENKEAAHAFIDYVLGPDVHSWVVENILYKVPNQAAMEQIDPPLIEALPNLVMTVDELFEQEELVDLGDAAPLYTEMATQVTAG
jgi:spermidine/putrescine transport system substrate-binding protein